ncbi:MAG TPA: SRPBCC family protein [Pseudonocardia sp.]
MTTHDHPTPQHAQPGRRPRRQHAVLGVALAAALTGCTSAAAVPADVTVDAAAPVVSHGEIYVDAPLSTVWRLQTDVANWPTWRSDVDATQVTQPFTVDSTFRWQTSGLDITSRIFQVSPMARTAWGGPSMGIDAIHVWTYAPTGNGVMVRTQESWSGTQVEAQAATLQPALDRALQTWLGDLKKKAEDHAPTVSAPTPPG